MKRTVKSKEDLLKMFRDETKYSKHINTESYEHKETVCMFAEEMFELCGKDIEMFTPQIDDNNFDFEGECEDGSFWLFKEEWLVPISEENNLLKK